MFHPAIISLIALRVILCPLFCGVMLERTWASNEISSTCTCSNIQKEHCPGHKSLAIPFDSPCDCPNGCDTGCVCQIVPEWNSPTFTIDAELSPDFVSAFIETSKYPDVNAGRPEQVHRLDLPSGRSIRLAFRSLQL